MVHSPSSEANWFASSQEIPCIFMEPEGAWNNVTLIITIIIIITLQNLLHEIYLTQIRFFKYLVIFVLTLVINILGIRRIYNWPLFQPVSR